MAPKEWAFLIDHIKPTTHILEWGAGGSTIAMARRAHSVLSVEHTEHWTREVRKVGLKNVEVHHVTTNKPYDQQEDGTYEQFEDYVRLPIRMRFDVGYFDLVLIDGRARGACSETAAKLATENTKVFMHDYKEPLAPDRKSYADCLKWFTIEKRVGSLVLLKRK